MHNRKFQSAVFLLAVIGLWEGACRAFSISKLILPAPSAIAIRLEDLVVTGTIWPHFVATLTSITAGLTLGAVAAILVGGAISLVPTLERLIYPYLMALQSVPKIAIAPLFIIWFGYGITSKIVVAGLMCFFPVLVAVVVGFRTVDPDRLDMMHSFGATRAHILLRLRIPGALTMIFAGLEIATGLAVIGAVVGEFVGAQAGLGYLITVLNFNLDVAGVFAVLVLLSAIGMTLHALVRIANNRLVFWQQRETVRLLS
jgi:NitT/TauT family transport system permease protein